MEWFILDSWPETKIINSGCVSWIRLKVSQYDMFIPYLYSLLSLRRIQVPCPLCCVPPWGHTTQIRCHSLFYQMGLPIWIYQQLFSWPRLILRDSHYNARDGRERKLHKKTIWGFFKSLFLLNGGYLAVSTEQPWRDCHVLSTLFGLVQRKFNLMGISGNFFTCADESNSRSHHSFIQCVLAHCY